MRQPARGLRRLGVSFDTVLTSPFVRARQTAEIVAESLGLEDRLEEISELTHESSVDQLISGLIRFQDREHALLVGHNPGLEELVQLLTGEQHELPTAALVHIAMPISGWHEVEPAGGASIVDTWQPRDS